DGVGAHRYREEGVFLGCDPADLDEHGTNLPAGNADPWDRFPTSPPNGASRNFGVGGAEGGYGGPPIGAGHDRLAHQHGVEAGLLEHGGILGALDPGLGHPQDAFGHHCTDPHGAGGVDLEGDQVSLVDPDQGGPG